MYKLCDEVFYVKRVTTPLKHTDQITIIICKSSVCKTKPVCRALNIYHEKRWASCSNKRLCRTEVTTTICLH